MKSRVIVIGGGIGGLSAAIHLAAAGLPVLILEQNEAIGGKMAEHRTHGFRWDTGPSVLTMKHVFDELFQVAGRQLEDYLTLHRLDPLTRYFYPDGVVLDASSDITEMNRQISALHPKDVSGYLQYLSYAADLYRITAPVFINERPPTLSRIKDVPLTDTIRIEPWLTMDRVIRRHIHSHHLRQLLGRFATYVGASPYLAPATLSVIAHVELTGGVWYAEGGIYAVASALQAVAVELGVQIKTRAPVHRIIHDDARVVGVELKDGTHFEAAAVVANVDVTTVYSQLLDTPAVPQRHVRRMKSTPTSCSGFIMLLGIEGTYPQLAHHNILFSNDYEREFYEIFDRGIPPTDPTIYIAITSRSDPHHAPPGCENWFLLVNVPPSGDSFDWSQEAESYRDIILNRIADFGFDIRRRIRTETHLTPLDLATRTGAWRGALYGISSNQALNAFRRPHNRSPYLKRLYFAGGTTHPGGGVPMVTLSGKVAASLLLEDLARTP